MRRHRQLVRISIACGAHMGLSHQCLRSPHGNCTGSPISYIAFCARTRFGCQAIASDASERRAVSRQDVRCFVCAPAGTASKRLLQERPVHASSRPLEKSAIGAVGVGFLNRRLKKASSHTWTRLSSTGPWPSATCTGHAGSSCLGHVNKAYIPPYLALAHYRLRVHVKYIGSCRDS
jgi:hypothetical protein